PTIPLGQAVSMGASKPATYGRFKTSQGDGSQFRPLHSVTPGEPLAQHCSLTRTEKQASEGPGGGNEPPGRCTDAATSSAGRRQRQLPPAEPMGALAGFASSSSLPEPMGALAGFAPDRPRSVLTTAGHSSAPSFVFAL